MAMHSAIYSGWIRHRRFTPRENSFRYQIFMMYLDLDELQSVLNLSPGWSMKRFSLARFRRSDFLGDRQLPLGVSVRRRIEEETGLYHQGSIRMLANLCYFGITMNPIVCYYCFDKEEQLRFIVADVHNTPWKERHSYVLHCDPNKKTQRIHFEKRMHVSPFNAMEIDYHWRSNEPGTSIALHLENWHENQKVMDSTLALRREEISRDSLSRVLWQYPFMTAKVIAAIYWQAMKLWLKGVPIHDHP